MMIAIQLDKSAILNPTAHRLRCRVGIATIYPDSLSCQGSWDYVKWNGTLKNNSQGTYTEGAFAGQACTVEYSADGISWTALTTGFISSKGFQRTLGRITDDWLSFSIEDMTSLKGTKRKISAVIAGYKISDPSSTGTSLLHYLGGLMGVAAYDAGDLSVYTKDLISIEDSTPWSEIKKLCEAYGCKPRFDNLGRLWFHPKQESFHVTPSSEWTVDADPNNPTALDASPAIGRISTEFSEREATRAKSGIRLYSALTQRTVFRLTEGWSDATGLCYVRVPAGASYPESGVLELDYKDPVTNESYEYVSEVVTPTVGLDSSYDIYATGDLEMVSFNGSTSATAQRPSCSQIILRNNTGSDVYIRKLEVRGVPHSLTDDIEVEEKAASIDEVDHVDVEVDGSYAASKDQLDAVLADKVAYGSVRRREFTVTTFFLPQIQVGTVITLKLAGETIACDLENYKHSQTGRNIATMRTQLVLVEQSEYTPVASPVIISIPPRRTETSIRAAAYRGIYDTPPTDTVDGDSFLYSGIDEGGMEYGHIYAIEAEAWIDKSSDSARLAAALVDSAFLARQSGLAVYAFQAYITNVVVENMRSPNFSWAIRERQTPALRQMRQQGDCDLSTWKQRTS